ncbi:MAG: ATP-dependent endonuclease [Planctomycetaceae bacterium]|nr:ATP-dependent endonuclease [Planctomycetaceae bacterium]
MKIKSIEIKNFRSFEHETILLNPYTCFVGPNGSGKSTILSALNVFFKEESSSGTTYSNIINEDYFNKNTEEPITITVIFNELNAQAINDLSDYVRNEELIVSAEAIYDKDNDKTTLRHYGQRMRIDAFRIFFEEEKNKKKAAELKDIYESIRKTHPDLPKAGSKNFMRTALREYEDSHPEACSQIPSEDDFYGINSTGKLAPFIQWVYVPAVKDAVEEGTEDKNSALGKLIARTVRSRINFEDEIKKIKQETLQKYQDLLDANANCLSEISNSLQSRLTEWAHPDVKLGMQWNHNPSKSVQIQPPLVSVKTGDGDFLGDITRMGHGLQRSYLLALLQELASSDTDGAPTLLLGCEEPELYQHPPQARHLADVLHVLSSGNNQILITTHSPLFVNGKFFENARIVQKHKTEKCSKVCGVDYEKLSQSVKAATGVDPKSGLEGFKADIHQSLNPNIAEMFFTKIPVFVEGIEDQAYITTHLHLTGQWTEFRRHGCHIIPVGGKSQLLRPIAIAKELGIPFFVIFDSDSDARKQEHLDMHERDNKALLTLLGREKDISAFPDQCILAPNFCIMVPNMTTCVKADFGACSEEALQRAALNFDHEKGMNKSQYFIAEWVTLLFLDNGLTSKLLDGIRYRIDEFMRNNN